MILITGGAGYIGSHTVLNFLKDNYYRLKDFKDRLIELIGDILMN